LRVHSSRPSSCTLATLEPVTHTHVHVYLLALVWPFRLSLQNAQCVAIRHIHVQGSVLRISHAARRQCAVAHHVCHGSMTSILLKSQRSSSKRANTVTWARVFPCSTSPLLVQKEGAHGANTLTAYLASCTWHRHISSLNIRPCCCLMQKALQSTAQTFAKQVRLTCRAAPWLPAS